MRKMYLIQWEQTINLWLLTSATIDKAQCLIFNLFKTIHIQIECSGILNQSSDSQIGIWEKAWTQLQSNRTKESLYTHIRNKEIDRLTTRYITLTT